MGQRLLRIKPDATPTFTLTVNSDEGNPGGGSCDGAGIGVVEALALLPVSWKLRGKKR